MMPSRQVMLASAIVCASIVIGCRTQQTTGNRTDVSSPSPRQSVAPIKSKVDVCNLLTSDDLKAVQGEAFKDASRSDRLDGDFLVAQCYYAMPTAANSVVIDVTTAKDAAGARTPKSFWEQTFGGNEEKERQGDRDRDKEKAKEPRERGDEGEAKEASPPERVKDLGDEAFWVASPIGGALYVLKNDMFVRISVGGAGDQKTKLNKSKTLAVKILQRLE